MTSPSAAFELPGELRSQGYALRPEREADIPFLSRLYASTREDEVAQVVGWTPEQRAGFLAMQFAAQRHHYRTHIPGCAWLVLDIAASPWDGFIWRTGCRGCTSSISRCFRRGAAAAWEARS
ncbi:MAG: hypothetical protein WDM81_14625 [Rhizomicrobium sp.]